jgi:hypothetical protein
VPVADDILSDLPGGQFIREGLIDHQAGRRTVASCLVEMAAPRLIKAGLLKNAPQRSEEPSELHLYSLLQHTEKDRAFSKYNSLLRLLTSFERALDQAMRREKWEGERV